MLFQELVQVLHSQGYTITSFLHCNSCFDLAAKKQGQTLLLKVLANIDALRPEAAFELKKLARIFKAAPLIIGERSKAFQLGEGVVYDRFGLNAVSLKTFNLMLAGEMPCVRYFKGKTSVELDSTELQKKRKQLNYSLTELAEKIGVVRESLHRYEKGVKASLETGRKLEKILACSLIKEINVFSEPEIELGKETAFDPAFERLEALGLRLSFYKHVPFKASSAKEDLLIGKGVKQDVKKKAMVLGQTKNVFDSHAMVLTKKFKLKSIDSMPIIEEEELHSLSKAKDLMKLVKEREK